MLCSCETKQKQTCVNRSELRSLLSLNQVAYQDLFKFFDPLISKKLSLYTLKGQMRLFPEPDESVRSSLYGSKCKLDLILMYLKENPNQSYHGRLYGISQSKVSEWVGYLIPVLLESLLKMGVMPQMGCYYEQVNEEIDYLLLDLTERVVRDIDHDHQKEFYSGKKKMHTLKNLIITDQSGYIEFISESYMGPVHDKTNWDQVAVHLKGQNLLADLSFIGIEKDCPNAILPFKKPKGGQLTELQKSVNQAIGSARVTVEHAFSGVKRLKIIREKIRLKSLQKRDLVFKIAAGLHNLRVSRKAIVKLT